MSDDLTNERSDGRNDDSHHIDTRGVPNSRRSASFLMKSLDDLELEKESGGIDDESYAALHDDYTARLAAALRSLRDDVDVAPKPPTPRATRPPPQAGGARDRGGRVRGRGRVARVRGGARLPGRPGAATPVRR